MREIIIIALLVAAVAGYRSPSYAALENQPFKATTQNELPKETLKPLEANEGTTITSSSATAAAVPAETTTLTAASSSSAATNAQPTVTTILPIEEAPNTAKPITEQPNREEESPAMSVPIYMPEEEFSKRRVVTYDQRQEGQYNIRADLENFMIVLIPPSAQEGLSLLDLLSKSSLRRNAANKSKRHRYAAGLNLQPGSIKYQQAVKAKQSLSNLNYLARNANEQNGPANSYHHGRPLAIAESTRPHIPEFIEGRTPYHVDISASDDEQTRLHPADRPVDVIPPPYPLAFQQLIKPYHLEAEPTVIQALPPTELATTSGNFLEQLLGGSKYRGSRALRSDNEFLDTNKLGSPFAYRANAPDLPFYRAEHSFGADKQYPPIDTPRYKDYLTFANARSWDFNADDTRKQQLDADGHAGDGDLFVPPALLVQDALDLDLQSGATGYIDPAAKALLSDGIARCAPGHRRDSYGVCREIEGY